MSSRVRELLGRVKRTDEHVPYHAQIDARFPSRGALSALEREIAEEVAHSLGRAGRKVEAALLELTSLGDHLDALADVTGAEHEHRSKLGGNREELLVRFNSLREHAERALRDLRIQREALGFRRHDEVVRRYVVPPRRK